MKFLKLNYLKIIIGLALIISLVVFSRMSVVKAAFPGTNGKIAFSSNRDGNYEIYVMNADGTNQARLTNSSTNNNTAPAWSPDGTKIAFVSDRDGNQEIYVMNADGSGQMRLTNNLVFDVSPAWSPDGSQITFYRDEAFGISQIWVMNADGSGETQLTSDAVVNSTPAWSPDGTMIAFAKGVHGGDAEVFVMNADGTGQTNLSNNQAHPSQDLDPDWSPDGARLVFFRGGSGASEIWVMNADGNGQTKLSTSSTVGDGVPVWSPDGAKIAFASLRNGNSEIYVMNADGSGQTNLTNNPAGDSLPDWQPTIPLINVAIDIKPGSDPNCFNSNGQGAIPVAILGSSSFDISQVDPGTVALNGQAVKAVGKSNKLLAHTEDVNADGFIDIVVQIADTDGTYQVGDTTATLTGKTSGGLDFQGTDSICIVP